ncbi:hypothetical protein M513_09947 [Trichuris suis]|uniref:Uncharacterized protein n=1 Tax=Trichuris suis TaxID=68888 RepID=A0A085LVX7_9BILA|nr:hypothetical protein M513_09947 [Trichuris suis]
MLRLVTRKPAGVADHIVQLEEIKFRTQATQVSDEITYRLAFPLNTGMETKPLDDLVWRRAKMGP